MTWTWSCCSPPTPRSPDGSTSSPARSGCPASCGWSRADHRRGRAADVHRQGRPVRAAGGRRPPGARGPRRAPDAGEPRALAAVKEAGERVKPWSSAFDPAMLGLATAATPGQDIAASSAKRPNPAAATSQSRSWAAVTAAEPARSAGMRPGLSATPSAHAFRGGRDENEACAPSTC
jgi:hypothetical protein